ncbi:MAG: hypothetical protein V7785_19765 [Bermanella sp.]
MTAANQLLLCLVIEQGINFRSVVRIHPEELVKQAIRNAKLIKTKGHYFNLAQKVKILRLMSTTDG